MKKKLTFLGIETSCDETAASIVRKNEDGKPNILSSVVLSQIKHHRKFGGVVPELAARNHLNNIENIISQALKKSKISLSEIDGVAATAGPGLLVCLNVGLNTGKTIAGFLNKKFVAINHLEANALSPNLETELSFPYLLLLISGGHTQFLLVKKFGIYKQLGTTIDDALGETFDKAAKLLGLKYPGGPEIEKLLKKGNCFFYNLPKPIINRGGCNLSFSGLKTAILRESIKLKSFKSKCDLAASFQKTIMDILSAKSKIAMDEFRKITKIKKRIYFVVAGGVAANQSIRKKLIEISKLNNFKIIFPSKKLCTDNAAMIAWAGILRHQFGFKNSLNFRAKPKWPLDASAPFMKGPGLKF